MTENKRDVKRQIITVAATFVVAFSVFCSFILNTAVSMAIGLYCYQTAEEDNLCMDSCCAETGKSPACCCYFSEIPNQTETLITYELFNKSIYNYLCAVHTFDNSDLTELYNVDCEIKNIPEYFVYKIFRPPKAI